MTSNKSIPKGIYIQIYRGAMNATHRANLGVTLDTFKSLGVVGIAWHGFTKEMGVNAYAPLAKLCADRGMLSLAAYGMGADDPAGMATRMAPVANLSSCTAILFDMEGAWEIAEGKSRATVLGTTFRALSPNSTVIDQPWFAPLSHWTAFPWEETAKYVDIRASQVYCNDFLAQYGKNAYEVIFTRYKNEWAKLDQRLAPAGLVRPEIKTIQGYKWYDIGDLVNCLTTYDTLIVWAEPYPDDLFMKGLRVKHALDTKGFVGADAVKNFQASVGLTADNICGNLTCVALGIA